MFREHAIQYRKDSPRAFQSQWERTRHTLDKFKQILDSHQIPWILVLLPAEPQVDARLQSVCAEFPGMSPHELNFEKPQEMLEAWAHSNSVAVLDLTPAFKTASSTHRLYLNNDIHWNRDGHVTAAATLLPVRREWLVAHQVPTKLVEGKKYPHLDP